MLGKARAAKQFAVLFRLLTSGQRKKDIIVDDQFFKNAIP